MFTGIIKNIGVITDIVEDGSNKHFTVKSKIAPKLSVDQSVSHNGICLTVIKIFPNEAKYVVTAIKETLNKTNLQFASAGDIFNLELSAGATSLLDGHIVQGHIDNISKCTDIVEEQGSWHYYFTIPKGKESMLVDKGSVCINGVSLTVINPSQTQFSVGIIPYTYNNTSLKNIKIGNWVNIEWDIIGKYVIRYLHLSSKN